VIQLLSTRGASDIATLMRVTRGRVSQLFDVGDAARCGISSSRAPSSHGLC